MCHVVLSFISSKQRQRYWIPPPLQPLPGKHQAIILLTSFYKSYEILINNSRLLTQSYQNEIRKWQLKQYDNSTMISITDINLPKFQKLINRAETSQPTNENYAKARDFYIKSLQSEMVL